MIFIKKLKIIKLVIVKMIDNCIVATLYKIHNLRSILIKISSKVT